MGEEVDKIPEKQEQKPLYFPADYDQWARFEYWTPHEFAALTLDVDPSSPGLWDAGFLNDNYWEHRQTLRFIRRAIEVGMLSENILPKSGLQWLRLRDLPCPSGLFQAVAKFHDYVDWKEIAQGLWDRLQDAEAMAVTEATAHEPSNDNTDDERSLNLRRYKSALILAFGICQDKFHYGKEGDLGRSAVTNVISALQRTGLSRDRKTIKSLLEEGEGFSLLEKE